MHLRQRTGEASRKGTEAPGKHTGENTGDPRQHFADTCSSGSERGTNINTGSRALYSEPQSMAVIGFSATLNRQVVGSIPTASTMLINKDLSRFVSISIRRD
jgi:hypothetical protein